jgi:hypothetical protein
VSGSAICRLHVVIYYVIALALYMQSSYREVLRCLKVSAGCSTHRRRSKWRASRASRKPARGWDQNRCVDCMTKWWLLLAEAGDVNKRLGSSQHREHTQQQDLLERISTLPACRGSGKSVK